MRRSRRQPDSTEFPRWAGRSLPRAMTWVRTVGAAAAAHAAVGIIALAIAGTATIAAPAAPAGAAAHRISVVAAEDTYGNVAAQIGGAQVVVTSIENNPNTDPHSYEVSPSVAQDVAAAQVVVQN